MTLGTLTRRVEFWQKQLAFLGIGHWRCEVRIMDECTPGASSTAAVQISGSYDTCFMEFKRSELPDEVTEELDETIIHEWLHVAWRDYDDVIQGVQTWMPDATYNDFHERIDHEREGIIERTSRAIRAVAGKSC